MTYPNDDSSFGEVKLPKLGFGAGTFSGAYNSVSLDECYSAVERSLELGINYFDTSPYYGDSEFILGEGLTKIRSKYPRSSYYLSTKVGRYGVHKKDFDYSVRRIEESVKESMRRLHTDYLDLVFCHDVEFVSVEQVVDEALPRLFQFKEEGKIRWVGISGYPLDTLLHIARIQYERNQPLDMVLSYCHYTLQNTLLKDYLPKFTQAGVDHILNASPLSMGLLRDGPTPEWHPAPQEMKKAVQMAKEICHEYGVSISDIASRFAFQYPGFTSTVIGCCRPEEIQRAYEQFSQVQSQCEAFRSDDSDALVLSKILDLLMPYHNYSWPSPPNE